MGNGGNERLPFPAGTKTEVLDDKIEKSWVEGRMLFQEKEKKGTNIYSSVRNFDLINRLLSVVRRYEILEPVGGHFIAYFEAFDVVCKEYKTLHLSNLDTIVSKIALWIARTDALFATDVTKDPEFVLSLRCFSRTLFSIAKVLRRACRPWKVIGVHKDVSLSLGLRDEKKIIQKGSGLVYAFEKICIAGRTYCRQHTADVMKLDDMNQLYLILEPTRFQLDFFAEAYYRASKCVSAVNEVPVGMAHWIYEKSMRENEVERGDDLFFLLYGSSCSGKTKFSVDLALNLRMQDRLLAAYFINPIIADNVDNAELFVRSVAYQAAIYYPQLRKGIILAAKKLFASEQLLSSQKETGRHRHHYLLGTGCTSRAVDLWNELVVGPWNNVSKISPQAHLGNLKGILKKSVDSYYTSESAPKTLDIEKNMLILVDGFGFGGNEIAATSFVDSIGRFFVEIQDSIPVGMKIVMCGNRDSDIIACCRLPKAVASSFISTYHNWQISEGNSGRSRRTHNPIPVHQCLDLDPLSTATILDITHGKCGCLTIDSASVCEMCSRVVQESRCAGIMSRYNISDIIDPSATSLVDVLLANRCGQSTMLYTSLAVDEIVHRFHSSSGVSYDLICSVIPQNISDIYRIHMERIINCDKKLFKEVGKVMIMLICNANRLLSVAELSWLLYVDVKTVLRVANYIEELFPLVYCRIPVTLSDLRIEQMQGDIIYSDGLIDSDCLMGKNPKPVWGEDDESTASTASSSERSNRASNATTPLYSAAGDDRRRSSADTHIDKFVTLDSCSPRRETQELHSEIMARVLNPPSHIVEDIATSLGCDSSSTDLTSEKVGLKSLRHISNSSEEMFYSHSEGDMHQYFYPIHNSLVFWCRQQNHLFPSDLYGHTSSRHHANNCHDFFVASTLEISRISNIGRKVGKKVISLMVKQKTVKRLLFASYNYQHLISHINASLNYSYIAPRLFFSLSWLLGVLKSSSVDNLLQVIDKACRDEWCSINCSRRVSFTRTRVQRRGESNNSVGSSEASLLYGTKKGCRVDTVNSEEDFTQLQYYTSLRYLWLCLSRGYFGLNDALSKFRASNSSENTDSGSVLEKELCFHIINWLTPIAKNKKHFCDAHNVSLSGTRDEVVSADSSSSLSMDSDISSGSLRQFSDISYINRLVGAAVRMNSSPLFSHGVPRLIYPHIFSGELSDHYLMHRTRGHGMPLHGHSNKVVAMCSVSDKSMANEYIASCSDDCTVRVWNAVSGACAASFSSHAGSVSCLLALPCGLLASGSLDLSVHILSIPEKCLKNKLIGHDGVINCLAHIPQDDLLASGSEDRTIRLWDYYDGGTALLVLRGHRRAITCLLVAEPPLRVKYDEHNTDSGSILLSGSADKCIRSWSVTTGKSDKIFKGHKDRVTELTGPFLWSSSESLTHIGESPSLADDRNDPIQLAEHFRFCSVQEGGSVIIWSYNAAVILFQISGSPITCMIDLSGDRFATACVDRIIAIWNVESCRQEHILGGHTKRVTALSEVSIGSITKARKSNFHYADDSYLCEESAKLLCSGSDDCTVMVWDILSGICLYKLEGPAHAISTVLFTVSFSNATVSCGCWDGSIHMWSLGTISDLKIAMAGSAKKERNEDGFKFSVSGGLTQHSNRITAMCPIFFPRETTSEPDLRSCIECIFFCTCSLDGTIRVWMLRKENTACMTGIDTSLSYLPQSMSCIAILKCDRVANICYVTQLSDGRLAVASLDNTIVIYAFPASEVDTAMQSGTCVCFMLSSLKSIENNESVVIKGLTYRVTFLTTIIGPIDGVATELLTTGSTDYVIRFYSVATGACVRCLDGHNGSITCIQSLSDGRILSGSDDGSVFLWNLNAKIIGNTAISAKLKVKPYISLLKGKCAVSAMFVYKPMESQALSPVLPSNINFFSDVQLCVVTADGLIHMRKIGTASVAAIEADKARSAMTGKKMAKIPSTKDVLMDDNHFAARPPEFAHYPVIHQLLSRGSLYGAMDPYSFKCAVGHYVSDTVTVGYSLQRNIVAAGTLQGEVFAFEIFDHFDSSIDKCAPPITSLSPLPP